MKERRFEPLKLDVQAFARAAGELTGTWPQADLRRLVSGPEGAHADGPADEVRWRATGETRARTAAEPETWLHLQAATKVWLVCQRCLAPCELSLEVRRSFLFAADEAQAEQLDEDIEEDVLAMTRNLDLRELVEDELILAMPIVPRHEHCPQPLVKEPSAAAALEEPKPNPFAVLETLRGGRSGKTP